MQTSKIEWTEATWNPVRGCSRISEGCRNCYAERMATRFSGRGLWGHGFADSSGWTRRVELIESKLGEPFRWKRPRLVFVNSTSDLFHESLSDVDIACVFEVMEAASQHTYQVLTKRAARMRAWYGLMGTRHWVTRLPNVWIGASMEDQRAVDERLLDLLAIPAAVRFASVEPLIGPVALPVGAGLDWVIVGGESGPGARPLDLDWIRRIRDDCARGGVPLFVKQLTERGHKIPFEEWPEDVKIREWPAARTESAERGAE